jgi:hypothetical protein
MAAKLRQPQKAGNRRPEIVYKYISAVEKIMKQRN